MRVSSKKNMNIVVYKYDKVKSLLSEYHNPEQPVLYTIFRKTLIYIQVLVFTFMFLFFFLKKWWFSI